MKAIHFGAGNIGRGFIGKLLADAKAELIFADIDTFLVDQLAQQQGYPVHIVGENTRIEKVHPISAVHSASPEAIQSVAQADIITTAVGPQILSKIAEILAQGLLLRHANANTQPMNIIACENMVRGSTQLKQHVIAALPETLHPWLNTHIGFVDSAVDRIVPPSEIIPHAPLTVTVETFSEWIVDSTQFKGPIPQIPGMELTNNLMAYVERKLFTLNTGHAITAYLGQLAGHLTIREAILDQNIYQIVKSAMEESGAVLVRRHGFDPQQHAGYIEKILARFANPYLDDDVIRVGRQPLRKLGAEDRLIKPLRGTLEYQLPHSCLLMGIAAALHYHNPEDTQAQEIAALIASKGINLTLSTISELQDQPKLVAEIVELYHNLSSQPTGFPA